MQDLQPATKDEAKTMLRAAVFLIKKAIDDKVYAVSMHTQTCTHTHTCYI